MSNGLYPEPTFLYQGAAQILQPVYIGPIQAAGASAVGTNYWADPTAKSPDLRIRPVDVPGDDDDPCTTTFMVFYSQFRETPETGVPFQMYFRITSDEKGGAVGAAASLEVNSNYPDINMNLAKFPIDQAGVGRMKTAWIPADYQATMFVRVWNNHADLSVDGYIMLECGYKEIPPDDGRGPGLGRGNGRKANEQEPHPLNSETVETTADPGLKPVGRVSLFPVQTPST